jgi:hypothetical protein
MRRLAVIAVMTACGGNPAAPDANHDQLDAVPPDSDPACGEWTVAMTTGTNLRLADRGSTHYALGRAVRLAYDLPLTACEQTSMGVVTYFGDDPQMPAVTPYVLRQVGGACTGTAGTVVDVVEYYPPTPGAYMALLTADSSVAAFTVDPEPTPGCDPTRTPCVTDCDCDTTAGERCIGTATSTTCARTCELDRDCNGAGRCTDQHVCDDQPECDGTHACPDGFACTAGACTPTFTLSQTTRHECACDADCDPGLRCVRPMFTSGPSRCQAMCETAGPWCQGPHVCGSASSDISGLATTDSVCGWIGD